MIPNGTFDIKALRAAVDKALNAVVRRMDSLDDLEPDTARLAGLITEYNAVIDGKKFLLAKRRVTNKSAHERDMDKYAELLEPLFHDLEQSRGLSRGALSFAREFRGSGKKRAYLLNVSGSSQLWVVIDSGKLVVVPEPAGKAHSGGHFGSGSDSNGGGSKKKPDGGGTKKPEREEDPGEDKA